MDSSDSANAAPARILIEVCVASLQGAIDAESAGADRIELNLALELDGLTPSAGLIASVRKAIQIPVIAMARPRAGDFCYSESEWTTLMADASWLFDQGIAGIAFGCLGPDGQVDLGRCRQMRGLAGAHELVFHKAFDEVSDWETGLDLLIESGIDRVMTSGQANSAKEGVGLIEQLIHRAANRIEILPAGGIGSGNAVDIVQGTGCTQLHGSFSSGEKSDISSEIGLSIGRLASHQSTS